MKRFHQFHRGIARLPVGNEQMANLFVFAGRKVSALTRGVTVKQLLSSMTQGQEMGGNVFYRWRSAGELW